METEGGRKRKQKKITERQQRVEETEKESERDEETERKGERRLSNSAIWLALLHYNIQTLSARVCVCVSSIPQMQAEQSRILIY